MQLYTQEDLQYVKDHEETISSYGMEMILKRSPRCAGDGYLDEYERQALSHTMTHVGEDSVPEDLSPEELVQIMRDSMGFPNRNLNTVEIITRYEELTIGENAVELWRYYARRSEQKVRPAFLMIHGGGWVGGSVYTVENFCRLVAERADAVVFSLEYSKGPEKPFPNAQNDIFGTVNHICEHAKEYGIDPQRISVGGDSAGGNLALSAAIRGRREGLSRIRTLILMYPCTVKCDAAAEGYEWTEDAYDIREASKEEFLGLGRPRAFGEDPIDRMTMQGEEDIRNPYYSPMLDPDKSGMPDTLMLTCEFDGLRLQDEFYAAQLRRAGSRVRCVRYQGITHAAIDRLGYIPQAEDMAEETAAAIRCGVTGQETPRLYRCGMTGQETPRLCRCGVTGQEVPRS